MIISPGRRYIFVHIPKTGGTSLALALEARAHRDDILIGDTPKARRRRNRLRALRPAGRLWKHATLADIDGVLPADVMATMLCVTLVRNPWDRVVSYYHWLRDQSFDHSAVAIAQASDFKEFILHEGIQDTLSRWPYGRYLQTPSGDEHRALFLRLEHLEQDIVPFAAHLGFEPEIPHVNSSHRRPDFRSYYTEQTHDVVARICAQDIRRFGYSFEDQPLGSLTRSADET